MEKGQSKLQQSNLIFSAFSFSLLGEKFLCLKQAYGEREISKSNNLYFPDFGKKTVCSHENHDTMSTFWTAQKEQKTNLFVVSNL